MFQIQNFLHVGSCHTGYFSVLYDLFRLRKRCCNTLQNSLIIDIHFHIGTRKGNVVYNIGGKVILGITGYGKLLFDAASDLLISRASLALRKSRLYSSSVYAPT